MSDNNKKRNITGSYPGAGGNRPKRVNPAGSYPGKKRFPGAPIADEPVKGDTVYWKKSGAQEVATGDTQYWKSPAKQEEPEKPEKKEAPKKKKVRLLKSC